MTDIIQQPVIDNRGNIRLHPRGGLEILFDFHTSDDQPRDVSASVMKFEWEGQTTITLTNTGTLGEKLLTLPKAVVEAMEGQNKKFALKDCTTALEPVLYSGVVTVGTWN